MPGERLGLHTLSRRLFPQSLLGLLTELDLELDVTVGLVTAKGRHGPGGAL